MRIFIDAAITRIAEKLITFPQSPVFYSAQVPIRSFCTIRRSRRLGNMSGGVSRVKLHPVFCNTNRNDLAKPRHKGPIILVI
ncbi:Pkinase-domain-containing protein [Tolypocladium paradoxum]|uniref:Pkinase-domain-containing protein n=1 Tax=Tolypocladium paradoxum TaxID=94208 RepID=A0A2S4L319_9HYPO|nr:Pkinase-domain-containing protein [Tolypocladium paradoxum]